MRVITEPWLSRISPPCRATCRPSTRPSSRTSLSSSSVSASSSPPGSLSTRSVLVNHSLSSSSLPVQVTSSKFTRELYKELLIAAVASVFMGFGTLFLLLWVGIYVWVLFWLRSVIVRCSVSTINTCISTVCQCDFDNKNIQPFLSSSYYLTSSTSKWAKVVDIIFLCQSE